MSTERESDVNELHQGGGDVPNTMRRPAADLEERLDRGLKCLPIAGTKFLGFELIHELGRGAFSRVFLARQRKLGNRTVALKISVDLFGEPHKLAQLQHTNIVPIYSAHDAEPLQALCMPYFGPSTLADLLRVIKGQSSLPGSGKFLVSMLRETLLHGVAVEDNGGDTPRDTPTEASLPLQRLEAMSHVQAMLWLVARLADGLAHAHEHGILHRDLKPANILLGNDGQPMLMDFNLAADIKLPADRSSQKLGGTIPYMAPEHLEAFQAGHGKVDARSDIFSMGVILYETLTGRLPFPIEPGSLSDVLPRQIAERHRLRPEVRRLNPAVSPAVGAMIRKCLAADPAERYQTAHDLAEDLQRQLDHLPLKHASEPSAWERVRKWRRRHPRLTSPASLAALAVCTVIVAAAFMARSHFHTAKKETEVEQSLAKASRQKADQISATARAQQEESEKTAQTARAQQEESKKTAQALVNLNRFHAGWDAVEGLQSQLVLASLPESARPRGTSSRAALEAKCHELLAIYEVETNASWKANVDRYLPPEQAGKLVADIGQALHVLAQSERMQLEPLRERSRFANETRMLLGAMGLPSILEDVGAALLAMRGREAMRLNELAGNCYVANETPVGLESQREALAMMVGSQGEASRAEARAQTLPVRDARDYFWLAHERTLQGRFQDALPYLEKSIRLAPADFSSWLLQAVCYHHLAEFDDEPAKYTRAEASYDTCIALRPELIELRFARARACLDGGNWRTALGDAGRLLEARPGWVPAMLLQASALAGKADELARDPGSASNPRQKEKALKEAIDRLSSILIDHPLAEVYFRRGQMRTHETNFAKRPKGTEEARRDFRSALAGRPHDAHGWINQALCRLELEKLDVMDQNWDRPAESLNRMLAQLPGAATAGEALADLERALELSPKDRTALDKKALLLTRMEQPFEALRVLDRLVDIHPDYLEARVRRAFLRARLGQTRFANQDAEEIRNREPTGRQYYNAARIFALTSKANPLDRRHALKLLSYALRSGYGWDRFRTDPDLAPLRQSPEFATLAESAERLGHGIPERMRFPDGPGGDIRPAGGP